MRRAISLLSLLPLVLTGCGKELVAGGQREVETVAVSDGDQTGSTSHAPAGAGYAAIPLYAGAVPQGTLSFTATASLVALDGEVVPLVREPRTATLRIEGSDTARVARTTVEDTRYVRARVVFTRVEADVTGGLVIGGVSVSGLIRVGIAPGDSVVVEREVRLEGTGEPVDALVIDLNTSAWLTAAVGGVVPVATFQNAVRLRAR